MKSAVGILLALAVPLIAGPEGSSVKLWVQLVHATQAPAIQPANWKPIGPELNKRLTEVFRWRDYYEVARQEMSIEPGKITKASLSKDREVVVTYKSPTELIVRLYRQGELVRKAERGLNQKMTIMGGDANDREAWFVVVRRDKPQAE